MLLQLWCQEIPISADLQIQNFQQLRPFVTRRESYSSKVRSSVCVLQWEVADMLS